MENLLIIGAGQSAIQCISTLKKEGYSGSITLVGEEEHLPYQRPPLSKGFLEDSIGKERLYFKKLEFFTENKVQLYLGLSAEKLEIDNQKVDAHSLYLSLKEEQIFVRYFQDDLLRNKLRITVGTEEQNQSLIKAIKRITQ